MDPTQAAILNQKLTENYISILEKTNQQIGLWSNPYSMIIAVLSTLFLIITIFIALMAIVVAYLIWKNSKDQRDYAKNFFAKQEKIIQQSNKRINAYEAKLDALIIQYDKQLKSASQKNKAEIQKAIDELKKEKATIGAYISPGIAFGGTASSGATGPTGHGGGGGGASGDAGVLRRIVCPYCDTIQPEISHSSYYAGMASFPHYPRSYVCVSCGLMFSA